MKFKRFWADGQSATLGGPVAARVVLGLMAAFWGLMASGCATNKPASASFASVVIEEHSATLIEAVTIQVFLENGYEGGSVGGGKLAFQKAATRGQTIAREGFLGAHEGAVTMIRVRAEVVKQGENAHRLQCQAFIVSGAGDAFFEEEQRFSNMRSGAYQKMLDEVAARMK